MVGAVGLERHGRSGLLRSLVVEPTLRKGGLGETLVTAIVALASERGLSTLSLLTTTADAFFARRGFHRVSWNELPSELSASRELSGACPSTAVAMTRPLV